ncbi:IclR family transcriptional regulator [Pseudalkalibacillus decolorationis]|uniref:IclR family transcriptional regulator n=1 Tax=Pseudalkalibacillus decolorationis TaxID=163879 RepID=UPI00214916E0|nr:IclR family transcriptional regulator [Pseudalkalibacillus decolorationis]
MSNEEKDRYLSNSLVRGLEILKMFNEDKPTLSLVEIANNLGVSRTTPFRLLYTLQTMGYLRQDESTKRYELSPKVLELGFTYLNTMQLPEIARPYLEELRDQTGASVHIGILDGREVAYIARIPGKGVTTINVTIGSRLPAHATAMGKILLAYQSKENLKKILFGTELQPFTEQTKTQIMELKQELNSIRQKEYSISNEEFESGIRSIAAPIFNNKGSVIASVNVVAPVTTLDDKFSEEVVLPALCKTANQLSAFSGYRLPK